MAAKTHDITEALNGLRDNLDISPADRKMLVNARKETRAFLKERFGEELRGIVKSTRVLDELPKPLFLTQGSFAYQTLNDPAPNNTPPQQMDLDDGVYFRASAIQGIDPGMLLRAMEYVLKAWAAENGWESETKPNCCRAILPAADGGVANKHIDWPIYRIRDDQAGDLEKSGRSTLDFSDVYKEWGVPYFDAGEVLLAHKEEGWKKSDPREVIDWVANMRKDYGKPFLNVCRYLKAWRDHQWADSPLKSIAIMAIVAQAFDEEVAFGDDKKDDDLLFAAAKRIAVCLQQGVRAPFGATERLDGNIPEADREEIQNSARNLQGDIQRCLYGDIAAAEICSLMRRHFGARFPNDSGLIRACVAAAAAGASAQTVKAAPHYAGKL